MEFPVVKNFLGTYPLPHGCIVIGLFLTVVGALQQMWYLSNIGSKDPEDLDGEVCQRQGVRHLAYGISNMAMGLALVVGVKEEAFWLVLMFVWTYSALYFIKILTGIYYMATDFLCNGLLDLFFLLFLSVIGVYIILVVMSYYKKVKSETEFHLSPPPEVASVESLVSA